MTRPVGLSIVLVCLAVVFLAGAAGQARVYSDDDLQSAARRYSENLRSLWAEDLLQHLPPKYREALADVRLKLPLRGEFWINGQSVASDWPFVYYAKAAEREVTIPILSVKYFDDLATTVSWLDWKRCSGMLAYQYIGTSMLQNAAASQERFPSVLQAFRVPTNVLDNSWIYEVSGNALKSGVYFIMAHELGHVWYKHSGSVPGPDGQQQETEADLFALEVMRGIAVPPVGIAILFMASARVDPVPDDYATPGEYQQQLQARSTHPLSGQRLRTIAQYIRANLAAFSAIQKNSQAVADTVHNLEGIAGILDDPGKRTEMRQDSRKLTLAHFAAACP